MRWLWRTDVSIQNTEPSTQPKAHKIALDIESKDNTTKQEMLEGMIFGMGMGMGMVMVLLL